MDSAAHATFLHYLGISEDCISFEVDAQRVRDGLKTNKYVRMSCFNKQEAHEIQARLTEDERHRVQFTWLTWKTNGKETAPQEANVPQNYDDDRDG